MRRMASCRAGSPAGSIPPSVAIRSRAVTPASGRDLREGRPRTWGQIATLRTESGRRLDDRRGTLWQIKDAGGRRYGSHGRTLHTLWRHAAKDGDDVYAHRTSWLATQRRVRRA